jgi:hypothetical protein
MLLAFPWLYLPLIAYNVIAFVVPFGLTLETPAFRLQLPSGAVWQAAVGDCLVTAALVLLLIEFLKNRYRRHGLDLLAAGVLVLIHAVEFAMRQEAATTVFVLLSLVAAINVAVLLATRPRTT